MAAVIIVWAPSCGQQKNNSILDTRGKRYTVPLAFLHKLNNFSEYMYI